MSCPPSSGASRTAAWVCTSVAPDLGSSHEGSSRADRTIIVLGDFPPSPHPASVAISTTLRRRRNRSCPRARGRGSHLRGNRRDSGRRGLPAAGSLGKRGQPPAAHL